MPRLTMAAAHALGEAEAVRRLKEKFAAVQEAYRAQISELQEEWNGSTLSFAFKAVGMKVAGEVTVEASQVQLAADLPMAAMMFKKVIEQQIRAKLGELLA
jgi:hypothetical protein